MRVVLTAFSLAVAALTLAASSHAGFPGSNGRLAFQWYWEDENYNYGSIATVRPDGTHVRTITPEPGQGEVNGQPDWSPNGRWVVYTEDGSDFPTFLMVVRRDGTHRHAIYRNTWRSMFLDSPVWSPNGRRIAFVKWRWSSARGDWVSDIFIVRRDGTGLRRVTFTGRASEEDLDWSSRGRLVFRRGVRFRERRAELYTLWPNGTGLRQLTDNRVFDGEPDWAPGGRRIAFVRQSDEQSNEIWKMRTGDRSASQVATGRSGPLESRATPTWAPDGSQIAFIGNDGIHTVRPNGLDETTLGSPVDMGSINGLDWQAQ